MCLLLQGNHSDQLELSYYAISSHLNNQNSRKPVVRAFFTHNDVVITRNKDERHRGGQDGHRRAVCSDPGWSERAP